MSNNYKYIVFNLLYIYNCFIFSGIIVLKDILIRIWEIILCLVLVAKADVQSVILSSWSAVLSCQIDVPYVCKPLAMRNLLACFKVNF
jgi:hypothetical protein